MLSSSDCALYVLTSTLILVLSCNNNTATISLTAKKARHINKATNNTIVTRELLSAYHCVNIDIIMISCLHPSSNWPNFLTSRCHFYCQWRQTFYCINLCAVRFTCSHRISHGYISQQQNRSLGNNI